MYLTFQNTHHHTSLPQERKKALQRSILQLVCQKAQICYIKLHRILYMSQLA